MAVVVGLTVIAVARSIGPLRDRPRVMPSPATEPQQPPSSGETKPAAAGDQAKPAYEGPLGDFLVGLHQGSDSPPCPKPFRPAKIEKIKASELYSPIFGNKLEGVTECADGRIVAIEIYGMEIIGKGYFVGKPIILYEVPLDRLKLFAVAGKPAIAQLPMPGFPGSLRLAVIERFPRVEQPGILVAIDDTFKSLEQAIELATRIMGVRP